MFFEKKAYASFFLFLWTSLLIISCGDDLFQDDSLRSRSGNCGSQVISDYNSVVNACNYDGSSECSRKKGLFLGKYPDVHCRAGEGVGLDLHEIYITRNKLESMPSRIVS